MAYLVFTISYKIYIQFINKKIIEESRLKSEQIEFCQFRLRLHLTSSANSAHKYADSTTPTAHQIYNDRLRIYNILVADGRHAGSMNYNINHTFIIINHTFICNINYKSSPTIDIASLILNWRLIVIVWLHALRKPSNCLKMSNCLYYSPLGVDPDDIFRQQMGIMHTYKYLYKQFGSSHSQTAVSPLLSRYK